MPKTSKKAKKFLARQKQANLRNKARGKKTVSIRDKKKKQREVTDLSDDEAPEREIAVQEKPILHDFTQAIPDEMSVEDFLGADFSSDDEDSEPEEPAVGEPPAKKRKLNNESVDAVKQHRQDLEKLKTLDPEFYAHLQENASGLLDFGKDEVDEEEEEDDDDEPMEQENEVLKKFTLGDLADLQKEAESKPLDGLRKLVLAFKSGTAMKTDDDVGIMLHFETPEIFSAFMKYMITDVPAVMMKIVKTPPGERIPKKVLSSRVWNRLKPLCRTYIACLTNFLKTTSDEGTQQYVLSNMRLLIPFLHILKADAVSIIKQCVNLWAYGKGGVRKDAFLTLLEMSIKMQHEILELTLKQMYLTFVKCIKKVNDQISARSMDFMTTCLVEIYGINPIVSYQHGFVYIRQLAIHLQRAMKNQQEGPKKQQAQGTKRKQGGKKKRKTGKTGKMAHLEVYNWRFLGCVKLFVKIVARHVDNVGSDLYPLVYPLVELTLALLSLHKGAIWFPLKIQYCELLTEMVTQCNVHIPVAPLLLELLRWPGLRKNVKPSTKAQLEIDYILRVNEEDLRTKACHEALVENCCRLLLNYFEAYSCCVAFPELAFPITMFLKKILKKDEKLHSKFKKQITVLVKKFQENAQWIKDKRRECGLAPRQIEQINTFADSKHESPLHTYVFGKQAPAAPQKTAEEQATEFLKEMESDEEELESKQTEELESKQTEEIEATTDVVEELALSESDGE